MKRIYLFLPLVIICLAYLAGNSPSAIANPTDQLPDAYRARVRHSEEEQRSKDLAKGVDFLLNDPMWVEAANANYFPGPDGYGYQGQTTAYQWIELNTTGTLVSGLTDDNYAGPINIGFSFPFYDTIYTQLMVESNGFLSLGTYGYGFNYNRCGLPHSEAPQDMIGIMWDDLVANYTTGGVYYQTYSSCPVGSGNCLVVEYSNWSTYGGSEGDAGTWEAILYASGEIRIQFKDVGADAGSYSTTGIQGGFVTAGWGLTYACNTSSSLTNSTAIRYTRPGAGITLYPQNLSTYTCDGQEQTYQVWLQNNTGTNPTFSLTYTPSASGVVTGPAAGQVPNGQRAYFNLLMQPPESLNIGNQFSVNITASGGGYSYQSNITQTITDQSFWRGIAFEPYDGRMDNVTAAYNGKVWSITGLGIENGVRSYDPATNIWATYNTPPSFGWNEAVSGCTHQNKVYIYGDTGNPSFTGLWSFDMAVLTWKQETPGGSAPAYNSIWAPAWVHDAETGYCYLTGGGSDGGTGNGDLRSTYVYDPTANLWRTGLPAFTTARDFHAAFIFRRPSDQHKLLCLAGGFGASGSQLSSTQCYDFSTAAWNAENTDLGGLGGTWAAMAYAQKTYRNQPQIWLIAGLYNGSITNRSAYYDFNLGAWTLGPSAAGNPVFRGSATVLNNEIYRLGGSTGSFSSIGVGDRHIQCVATQRTLTLPITRRNYFAFVGPNEHEPNNDWNLANGPLRSGSDYYGYVDDEMDIYYFDTTHTGKVIADLMNMPAGDIQFQLYSVADLSKPLVYDTEAPFHLEYTISVPAGKYYLLIYNTTLNPAVQYTVKVTYP